MWQIISVAMVESIERLGEETHLSPARALAFLRGARGTVAGLLRRRCRWSMAYVASRVLPAQSHRSGLLPIADGSKLQGKESY